MRCIECNGTAVEPRVGQIRACGHEFLVKLAYCTGCNRPIDQALVRTASALAAGALLAAGLRSGDIGRLVQDALEVDEATLAGLLGVQVEQVMNWRANQEPLDPTAVRLLSLLMRDAAAGANATMVQLEQLQEPLALPEAVAWDLIHVADDRTTSARRTAAGLSDGHLLGALYLAEPWVSAQMRELVINEVEKVYLGERELSAAKFLHNRIILAAEVVRAADLQLHAGTNETVDEDLSVRIAFGHQLLADADDDLSPAAFERLRKYDPKQVDKLLSLDRAQTANLLARARKDPRYAVLHHEGIRVLAELRLRFPDLFGDAEKFAAMQYLVRQAILGMPRIQLNS